MDPYGNNPYEQNNPYNMKMEEGYAHNNFYANPYLQDGGA